MSLPIVPGGEGYAMSMRAAYGQAGVAPAILRVTTLADRGAGSLREALETTTPRVIIFEISGTIALESDIRLVSPFVTVAGQTAPSPGILIRNFGISITTHDVFLQHLRIRAGDGPPFLTPTADHDGLSLYYDGVFNVVVDHCSISWAAGKSSSVYNIADEGEVCYWQNILSEALLYAKNCDWGAPDAAGVGPSSLALLLKQSEAGVPSYVSLLGNLFAHCAARNPEIQGPVHLQMVNNVVYDWGKDDRDSYQWATLTYGISGEAPPKLAIVGNVYKAGPGPHPFTPLYAVGEWSAVDGSELYLHDNRCDGAEPYFTNHVDHRVTAPPVPIQDLSILPSSEVEASVLARAGCRPADRDSVDRRIIQEVQARTGTVISSQDQVGGWPALASATRALTVPADPHTLQPSGYTALEEWLHTYAREVEGATPVVRAEVAFDYREEDLMRYQVTHFEGSWNEAPFELLHAKEVTLPDTPAGSKSYTVTPPPGARTFAVRAANVKGGGVASSFSVMTVPLVPPQQVRIISSVR
jgi:hypothetical protein